jgi:hypothetical protein
MTGKHKQLASGGWSVCEDHAVARPDIERAIDAIEVKLAAAH